MIRFVFYLFLAFGTICSLEETNIEYMRETGMDDYHAFMSTTGKSGGSGCSTGCLPWILVGLAILYLTGKLFA